MTAGVSAGTKDMRVSVSCSTGFTEPYAPYYIWIDRTDPGMGMVRIEHWVERGGFDENLLNYAMFTVEPSSFGFLDPEKPYGFMPMAISQSFYMRLNTGDSVNLTFKVALWNR